METIRCPVCRKEWSCDIFINFNIKCHNCPGIGKFFYGTCIPKNFSITELLIECDICFLIRMEKLIWKHY